MVKEVVALAGAGQIGLAIVRRIGFGKKIVLGDKSLETLERVERLLLEAGFDVKSVELDLSSKASIEHFVAQACEEGVITHFINAAGLSPAQASIRDILQVDLYGTTLLLEEVGKVMAPGGAGVTITSQSAHRLPALSPEQDKQLALTPVEHLLDLECLQEDVIENGLHAYQLSKRANEKRVMAEAVKWGKKKARINAIAPGIVMTPLALDELQGERGAFYQELLASSPAGRAATSDEIATLAELLLSSAASFITGSTFLIDGGATAAYFYGES